MKEIIFAERRAGGEAREGERERVAKSRLEDEKKRGEGGGGHRGEGKRMNEEEATFARRKNRVAKWSAGYRVTERQELYCFAIELEERGERTPAGSVRALISSRHKESSSTFCV